MSAEVATAQNCLKRPTLGSRTHATAQMWIVRVFSGGSCSSSAISAPWLVAGGGSSAAVSAAAIRRSIHSSVGAAGDAAACGGAAGSAGGGVAWRLAVGVTEASSRASMRTMRCASEVSSASFSRCCCCSALYFSMSAWLFLSGSAAAVVAASANVACPLPLLGALWAALALASGAGCGSACGGGALSAARVAWMAEARVDLDDGSKPISTSHACSSAASMAGAAGLLRAASARRARSRPVGRAIVIRCTSPKSPGDDGFPAHGGAAVRDANDRPPMIVAMMRAAKRHVASVRALKVAEARSAGPLARTVPLSL